jgi:hypothetical protein
MCSTSMSSANSIQLLSKHPTSLMEKHHGALKQSWQLSRVDPQKSTPHPQFLSSTCWSVSRLPSAKAGAGLASRSTLSYPVAPSREKLDTC